MSAIIKKYDLTFYADEVITSQRLTFYEGDTNVLLAFELYNPEGDNILELSPTGTSVEAIFVLPEGDKIICPLSVLDNRVFVQYSVGKLQSEKDRKGTLHLVKTNSTGTEESREVLPSIELTIKKNPAMDFFEDNLLVASDGAYLVTSDHDYILI